MKKIVLVIMAVAGMSFYGNAQSLHFGAKGGVNFADLSDVSGSGRTGYHIGLLAEIGFSQFAIQPEVIYSAQGVDDLELDYLNIPILAKYYVIPNLSIEAGPQFGFNVKDDDFPDSFGDIKTLDMGGAVGVGYKFGSLFAQARYNFGFSDIADNVSAKNSVFQLSVGYLFF
ncbi:porin family protein [Sinomicrobium sp. M5D2P9]